MSGLSAVRLPDGCVSLSDCPLTATTCLLLLRLTLAPCAPAAPLLDKTPTLRGAPFVNRLNLLMLTLLMLACLLAWFFVSLSD
jgi:hypothetical protein